MVAAKVFPAALKAWLNKEVCVVEIANAKYFLSSYGGGLCIDSYLKVEILVALLAIDAHLVSFNLVCRTKFAEFVSSGKAFL